MKILTMKEYRDEMCLEAYNRGKAEAIKQVLEIIQHCINYPHYNSVGAYVNMIDKKELKAELEKISK